MNKLRIVNLKPVRRASLLAVITALLAVVGDPPTTYAAISWDGEAGTHWWFDEVNWSTGDSQVNNVLPPSDATGAGATDTQINISAGAWNQGEGVVYDPSPADPNFAGAGSLPFPSGFGPQVINQLYMSRNSTQDSLLTIKGDLQTGNIIIGRSSGQVGVATNATIVQTAGLVKVVGANMDLAQTDTSNNGYGHGTYDYRGGSLQVGLAGSQILRLSAGTVSNAPNGAPAGSGGTARFIMHNPASGGHVRIKNVQFASFAGTTNGVFDDGDPDGITRGVAIAEFHYENGGVRPMQVMRDLSLNNGFHAASGGTRSSRLDLNLNEPVTLGAGGVPINLGLFDVDFDQTDMIDDEPIIGTIGGAGTLSRTFSSADGLTNYPAGSTVSAVFGNTTYNWTISYTGDITWSDADNSVLASVDGTGGRDIVLVGLSSQTVATDDADFDGDNDVDGADFLIWQRGLGVGNSNATGDANGNSVVDGADLAIWKTQFGPGGPAVGAIAAVPEPAGCVMFALAALALYNRRRDTL